METGIEVLLNSEKLFSLKGKQIALVTNHTGVDSACCSSVDLLKARAPLAGFVVKALFSPEHGFKGSTYAELIVDQQEKGGIPIYSLYGKTRRPTKEMLKEIDVILYDIQDIGSRSYTYLTTLLYVMEEAAKAHIPVWVLDRPNPINGLIVDGPMLEDKWRSMVGYLKVPYCHGMTLGELALYFNGEEKIGCDLHVIAMKGWKREMSFSDTHLPWIPTSPNIPEPTTPLFYPMTGILGELSLVNIGIGYTLPFKVVGAPWIDAERFAEKLNAQKFPGVHFFPFHFTPFWGKFSGLECQGVLIQVTDPKRYLPVATQYLLIGILKSLYPKQFAQGLKDSASKREMFCKVNGTEQVLALMEKPGPIVWKLRDLHKKERAIFLSKRARYLLYR